MELQRKIKTYLQAGFGLIAMLLSLPALAADYFTEAQQYYQKDELPAAVIQLKNLLAEEPKNAQGRLLLGEIYLKQGQLQDADKELSRAKLLGLDGPQVLFPLARVNLQLRQFDRVIEMLDPEQMTDPADKAAAYALLGHTHLGKNQIADAIELFEKSRSHKDSASAIVGLARIAASEQRWEDSLSLLEQAIVLEPGFREALFTRAQILASQGRFKEALEVYNELLLQKDDLPSALLGRAEIEIRLNQLEAAADDAQKVLKDNPMQPQANFVMSRLQLSAGQYPEAQASAEKVLRFASEHMMSFFVLGAAHYAQENMEQAKMYLEKFLVRQPSHPIAARLLGAAYLKLDDPENAVQLLEPLGETSGHDDAQLLNVLGRAYLRAGDFDKGVETLNRAIAIVPELEGVRTQIALGELAAGNTQSAISQLETEIHGEGGNELASVMLILSHLRQGELADALREADSAILRYKGNATFLNLKGLIFEARNEPDNARSIYHEALTADSQYIPALLAIARLDLAANDRAAARANYLKALKVNPKHLQTMLALAQLSALEGDVEAYQKDLLRAREANPESAAPAGLLVRYYLGSNQLDKALNEAQQFYRAQPDNLQANSLLAVVYGARNEFGQMQHQLRIVLEKNPRDLVRGTQLAEALLASGDWQPALEQINKVLLIDERYLDGLAAKVRILIAGKKIEAGRDVVAQLQGYYPDHYAGLQLLGDLSQAQGDEDQALNYYEQAFAMAKTPYLIGALHQLYLKLGKLEPAIVALRSFLEVAPGDNVNRLRLANTHQLLGQNREALAVYGVLEKAAPKNIVVLNNTAWLYWLEGDDRALQYAQRSYDLAPDRAEVVDTLGWVMLHKGDRKKALEYIQIASSRAPTNAEIHYHLGVALSKNGQNDQAVKELRRTLRDYPDFVEAAAARELLDQLNR